MFKKFFIIALSLFIITGCTSNNSTPTTESNVNEVVTPELPDENLPLDSNETETNEINSEEIESEENIPGDTTTSNEPTIPATDPTKPVVYSFAEVAKHDNPKDCWVVVSGKVHNLTTWIYGHPGGQDAIIGICGTDATEIFLYQHGGSSQAKFMLTRSQIGTVKK
jgi:cytochrome b involved in lipid metabolism